MAASRLRPLTPAQLQRLQSLRAMARLLDTAFRIPGTSYRVGIDPILGLIPALGDLVSIVFTAAILRQAVELRIPRVVQTRMLMNVGIDAVVGAVPLIGDLFDAAWKANNRNFALLERHAFEQRAPSTGDWVFVVGLIAALVALASLPFVLVMWLVAWIT